MKNIKIVILLATSIIALSSCLGDVDSKIQSEGFAYITKQNSITSASVNSGTIGIRYLVTSSEIQESTKLAEGMCAWIEFEMINPNTQSINNANYARVKNDEIYSVNSPYQNIFSLKDAKPTIAEGKEFYPSAFSISNYNPVQNVLNDHWKCSIQPGFETGDNSRIIVHFVYDKQRQFEDVVINNETVQQNITDRNKVVLDVYFEKDLEGTAGFQPVLGSVTSNFVGKLGEIRNLYKGDPSAALAGYSWFPVQVKFRYTQRYQENDEYKTRVIYLGNWSSWSSGYSFYYTKEA